MKSGPAGPAMKSNKSPNTRSADHMESAPRRARMLFTGWQGGIGLQHVPSGIGPEAHLPPNSFARAQDQRSPFLMGVHSCRAMHWPPPSGPTWQALPSAAQPQTHFWPGRSYFD